MDLKERNIEINDWTECDDVLSEFLKGSMKKRIDQRVLF